MEEVKPVSTESEGLTISFAERYLRLQLQKKAVGGDIKELKREFEEQGLPTRQVIKALDRIRKELKDGAEVEEEILTFKDMLFKQTNIQNQITELDAKV